MPRIVICLLLAALSTSVAAREVKMSSPNSGACADAEPASSGSGAPAPASGKVAAPASESRHGLRPDVEPHRVPGVRWHSFLPGMFR